MIRDAHAHFFSPGFFRFFAQQVAERRPDFDLADLGRETGLEPPRDAAALADRWVAEMDEHGVGQMVAIASVPGDEESVLSAAERHPERFAPFAMMNPRAEDAADRLERAAVRGLCGVCLFPAMHHFRVDSDELVAFVGRAAERRLIVFVHFGLLKLGIRDKLGLPSPFDLRYSNPIDLCRAAQAFPSTPFLIPHFGAGFFREALLVARQCANVYLDSSSSNSWTVTQPGRPTLRDVFAQALEVVGPGRILFGSDSGAFPRGFAREVLDAQSEVLAELGLTGSDRADVLGGNLGRLLSPQR